MMATYDTIPLKDTSTMYTSISPQSRDYFVGVDTYQPPAVDPQILHSLVATTDQTTRVADFKDKCGKLPDIELQDLILRTRTQIVPNLVKKKNIEELASLLVCRDGPFRRFILLKLRAVINCLDVSNLSLMDATSCLRSMINIFPDQNVQDVSMCPDLCLPVIYLVSALELLYCCRSNEKDLIRREIASVSKILTEKISPLLVNKKFKKDQPKSYAALKCVSSFIKPVSTRTLSTCFQGMFERWEDSFFSKQHAEQLSQIVEQPFFEQYMVLFALLLKLKNNIPVDDHFSRFAQQLFLQNSEKKWKKVQQHALSEMALRGAGSCLRLSKRSSETLIKVMRVCWKGMQQLNGFLSLPEELTDHLFMGDEQNIHIINQSLGVSEPFVLECAEKHVQQRVPDIVIHDTERQSLPKMSDNSYWSICQGRINKCQASVAIRVPGIETSREKTMEDIKNKMLKNDLKILIGLQKDKTHSNVVRLLAYSSLQNSVQFYVKDEYKMNVLEKLLEVRNQKGRLPVTWFNRRLQDITKALIYIHGEKIIHRDVTLRSFRLHANGQDSENNIAVLYDFNLACQTDFSKTAIGRVTDLQGDVLPVRWAAEETILKDSYDTKTDIWMFGHVIHELFTYGCEPFTDQYSLNTDDIISGVLVGNISPYWWPCIPHAYHLLSLECWRSEPNQRPSADSILRTLHDLEKNKPDATKDYPDLPKIGPGQRKRGHEPERGISPFIKELKHGSLERKENVMNALFDIRSKTQTEPRLADVTREDVTSPRDSVAEETGENLAIREQVSEDFCERIYNSMSPDFCEKMGIVRDSLRRGKQDDPGSRSGFVLTYQYPKCVNILKRARETVSPKQIADILLSVAQLVQRMHDKRWLLVSLTGRNVYIQQEGDSYTAFFVKLGRMVRVPETSDPADASMHVSEKLDDLIFWLPREVSSFGHLSRKSDVYTMAMLFYQVYMAFSTLEDLETVPYSRTHKSCILGVINEGQKPKKPPKCPSWLYDDVMMPCWHSDRSQRPSIDEIVRIMTQRFGENAGISASSVRDAGYLVLNADTCGMGNAGSSQDSGQYADVIGIGTYKSLSGKQNFGQSLNLNETEMAHFDPHNNHTNATTASSSVILPTAVNTEAGNLQIRLSEPQVIGGRHQPTDWQLTTKTNPLYHSITESTSDPPDDSLIRSSDFMLGHSQS